MINDKRGYFRLGLYPSLKQYSTQNQTDKQVQQA